MLVGYGDWPGLEQVCCVARRRTLNGTTERETHYYIASLSAERWGPEAMLELIRRHWDVENGLHYVRDVTFDEDRCRVRTGSGPRVFASVRNAVIGLLRNRGSTNIAAAVEDLQCHPPSAVRLILCGEN
jgi:predicted transposase YbfD/YdcC